MEPISTALAAFAAVQKTVEFIKKASATVDDVASLGPLLGKYFDQKHQAVKAVREVKKHGGSNLGRAIEIELALKKQRDFEEEVKSLFFATNNMDLWQNIMRNVAQMDAEDKEEERRQREAERKAKRRQQEINEMLTVVAALAILVGLVGYGTWMVIDHCKTVKCGHK